MKENILRTGDTVQISGDYQYQALNNGFVVQRFWHQSKMNLIEHFGLPRKNETVLDIGCGSGVLSDFLSKHAKSVLAVDGNENAIIFAKSKFSRSNLSFSRVLFHELDYPEGTFDAIYIFEVLEHIYEKQVLELLLKLQVLLKPGGRIIITTPDFRSFWPILEIILDKLKLVPKLSEEQHVFKINKNKLRKIVACTNLKISKIQNEFGIAPFLSVISWKLAEKVRDFERKIKCPLGMIICVELKK